MCTWAGLGEVGQQTTGFLAALDAQSGKEVWRLDAGDYVSCQPLVAGDTVYFGSSDFNVYALDAKTGRSKWTIRTDGQIYKLRLAQLAYCM
jgi:eukaryotic-like serine/threonine-protein kinase